MGLLFALVKFKFSKIHMRSVTTKHKASIKNMSLAKLGASFIEAANFKKAIEYYVLALKKLPNDAYLHYCHAVALHQDKQVLLAIGAYCQALQLNPKLTEAFENLAEAQTELKLFDDALLSIRAAIALKPNRAISHTRLARILVRLGQHQEAIDVATHALKLSPKNATTHMIRSNAHRALNQLQESIADLRQAIALDPNNPELPYNLSFDLLLSEQFEEGWQRYESRFETENFLKNTPQMVSPKWNGADSLDGKTILVCPEQGLGDQIQFARYALVLLGMGAKVIMPVAPALVDIVQSMHPDVLVTSSLQPASSLPQHDYYISLMSLLGIFKTDLSNIPYAERYITPNEAITAKWQARFANKSSKPQVGITWSGSQLHVNDHNRSMSLKQLAPLLNLDVDWHILQTEIREADEVLLPQTPLKDWRPELTSLHETAGLLDQLDLLITVDTSVAHLSAALGKPTWIMLPYAPDFRWLLNRSDTPWYPSVQLFRQSKPRDWESVTSQIVNTLTQPC
jgi:tetratricopeptide (TPR) repeat protein